MCQARRDGGRRCPIHRHDSVAAISLAIKTTGLSKAQVEHTFRELTREGRGTSDPTDEQWKNFRDQLKENLPKGAQEVVTRNLSKAEEHSTKPDGKTFYSMKNLASRVASRKEKLTALIDTVSREKGYSVEQLRERFDIAYEAAKRSHGEGQPEGYSHSAYLWAKNQGLPYDTQSVVAIDTLRSLPANQDDIPRVRREETGHSLITEIGHTQDGGRLELKMSSGAVLAYHNVPRETFESLYSNGSISDRVGERLLQIMANSEYQYRNVEEAELDSRDVRCDSCGQFASPVSHSCPVSRTEEAPGVDSVSPSVESEVEEQTTAEVEASETDASAPEVETAEVSEASAEAEVDSSDEVEASETDASVEEGAENAAEAVDQDETPAYDPANPQVMWDEDNAPATRNRGEEIDVSEFTGRASPSYINRPAAKTSYVDVDSYYNSETSEWTYPDGLPEDEQENFVRIAKEAMENNQRLEIITAGAGSYAYVREGKVTSVRPVQNMGVLQSGHMVNSGERGTHTVQPYTFNEEVDAYPIDLSGDFTKYTYRDATEGLPSEGEGRALIHRATANKNITLDARCSNAFAVHVPPVREIRKALNETDSFHMNLRAEQHGIWSGSEIDDQGKRVKYYGMEVSGYVEFKKDEEGKWNAVYDRRKLKCDCRDYRRYYNCHHIDTILRKANNVLYQSGAFASAGSGSARVNLNEVENGQYLNAALARRTDMTVTPPNEKTGEPLRYTFSGLHEDDRSNRRMRNWLHRSGLNSYRPYREINSFQEYLAHADDMSRTMYFRSVKTVENPRDVAQALNRGGVVQIPLNTIVSNTSYYTYRQDEPNVTGTVDLKAGENGEIVMVSRNLKCSCDDYATDYDCKHVRAAAALAVHLPNTGTRDYTPATPLNESRRITELGASEEVRLYRDMREIHLDHPELTEEVLRQRADEARAERTRLAEEHRERERLREIERARRQREERQTYYERLATQNRQAVEDFKNEHPEYAQGLTEYREKLLSKWDEVESSYVQDKEKLESAIKEARSRKAKGEEAVPFRAEGGVLDGAGDGPAGRKFGVELEFTIPSGRNREEALNAIARELHEAGLTSSPYQEHYHSGAVSGYSQWSFERDATVDGELVSPILDDSPESWRQLKQATDILKKHGAITNTQAGSHVHVSTGSYETSAAKVGELLRLNKEYEDITYRLATNPTRGTHRGTAWCRPNAKDGEDDLDLSHDITSSSFRTAHSESINSSSITSNLKSSNVEFRTWDGTLDPGVIQAQVMMSVAMTDRAEYNVLKNGKSSARLSSKDRNIGYNRNNSIGHDETHNEGGFAEFLDTMFRKDEDKNHIASLFAVTKWQGT